MTLQADNRTLVTNSKYTYLTQNYASGVNTVTVANTEPIAVNNFILIGEIGHSDSEIFQILTINGTTGDITLGDINGASALTVQPHPESTKVTVLPYNQVKFFWTAALGTIADETPVFDANTPLSGWLALDPSSYYSTYLDAAHTTGFGWFEYKNSVTTEVSQQSNPIPYAGFSLNTVSDVFANFDSLLNVRELKMVSMPEKFAWLNEALAVLKNRLNLTSVGYFISTTQTLNIIVGTAEYLLSDDFSELVEITDGLNTQTTSGKAILFLPASQALSQGRGSSNFISSLNIVHYYIRNRYIGFAPTPTIAATYYYTYRGKAMRLTSLSDYIDLPDNSFYSLKDFMMYRAKLKFGDPAASAYFTAFTDGMNAYIQSAIKRDADLDSWDIDRSANT